MFELYLFVVRILFCVIVDIEFFVEIGILFCEEFCFYLFLFIVFVLIIFKFWIELVLVVLIRVLFLLLFVIGCLVFE